MISVDSGRPMKTASTNSSILKSSKDPVYSKNLTAWVRLNPTNINIRRHKYINSQREIKNKCKIRYNIFKNKITGDDI